MQKRGLSTIIVSLILIMLSLVAIGVVWVVVSNILESSTQETDATFGGLFLSMDIQKVQTTEEGDIEVTIKRNAGAGTVSAIEFVISDGKNSEKIRKDIGIDELETKKFVLDKSELGEIGLIKEISVVPVLLQSSGEEKIGNVADERTFSNEDLLESIGAVSWWRLNGNARDEIGNNHGTTQGGVSFVDGKFEKAASFDGVDGYIDAGEITEYDYEKDFSVSAWVYLNGLDGSADTNYSIVSDQNDPSNKKFSVELVGDGTISILTFGTDSAGAYHFTDAIIDADKWYYVMFSVDRAEQIARLYVDGTEELSFDFSPYETYGGPTTFKIGSRRGAENFFNGELDEVILFSKALSAEEVKSLYNLDLKND